MCTIATAGRCTFGYQKSLRFKAFRKRCIFNHRKSPNQWRWKAVCVWESGSIARPFNARLQVSESSTKLYKTCFILWNLRHLCQNLTRPETSPASASGAHEPAISCLALFPCCACAAADSCFLFCKVSLEKQIQSLPYKTYYFSLSKEQALLC